ncbi:MAG: hypothetical protein HKM02_07085 [Pseudomonadales bacterium]|nr:hypothetical protein [Pseudomonadales bacterium]
MALSITASVVERMLQQLSLEDEAGFDVALWRMQGYAVTLCSEDDLPAKVTPVAACDRYRIFLVDSSQHCARLTRDYDRAVGIVVAEVSDEN